MNELDETPTTIVTEWKLKVCEVCGGRVSPHCSRHPEALSIRVTVVPKYPEWFLERIGQ